MASYQSLTQQQKDAVNMIEKHTRYNSSRGVETNSFSRDKIVEFVLKNWNKAQEVVSKNKWMSPITPFSSAMSYVDYKSLRWVG